MKKTPTVYTVTENYKKFIIDICVLKKNTAIGILDVESDEFTVIQDDGSTNSRKSSITSLIELLKSKSAYGTIYIDHVIDRDGRLIPRLKKEGYEIVRLGGSYNSLINKVERKWAELRARNQQPETDTQI